MARERKKRPRSDERTRDTPYRASQEIERLREENERLRQQLEEQAKRIADLERQLAPEATEFDDYVEAPIVCVRSQGRSSTPAVPQFAAHRPGTSSLEPPLSNEPLILTSDEGQVVGDALVPPYPGPLTDPAVTFPAIGHFDFE